MITFSNNLTNQENKIAYRDEFKERSEFTTNKRKLVYTYDQIYENREK